MEDLLPQEDKINNIKPQTNWLLEQDRFILFLQKVEKNEFKSGEVPELWDGKATNRAIEIMKTYIK